MKKVWIGILTLSAMAVAAQASAVFTADADTYVRGANTVNYGGDDELEVKLMTSKASGNFKSVIRFDAGLTDLSAATNINLALVLSVEQDIDDTFHLYGVKDASALESFGETTLSHADPVFSDDYVTYPYGIDTTVAGDYFYDSDSDGADVLASFSITNGTAVGSTVNISTPEMLAFAQDSANGLLTFVLVQTSDTADKTKFASKEHATYAGPALTADGATLAAELWVNPDSIAMDLDFADNSATSTVDVSYVSSTNIDITITISDTNSLGFSVLSATPQTLTNSPTALEFEFDNSVANLTIGQSATGLVTVAWSETGGGFSSSVLVPISVMVTDSNASIWDGATGPSGDAGNVITDVTNASDTVWSTTTLDFPVVNGNIAFKTALSRYVGDGTVSLADTVIADEDIDSLRIRVTPNTNGLSFAGLVGFDTTDWSAERVLSAIIIEGADTSRATADFRWFVESAGSTYVSEVIGTVELTTTLILDNSTSLEWFEFDDTVNITNAIGASIGTGSLTSLAFADVDAVGYYFVKTNMSDLIEPTWIEKFSASSASGYAAWAASYGLSGVDDENNDEEPDGLDNLMEYALGGNPTNDDAAAVSPSTYMAADGGTDWFYHVHNQNTDSNLTFTVGATPNLVVTAADTNDVQWVGETAETNGFKTVTNRTEATPNAKFIKLEVTQ